MSYSDTNTFATVAQVAKRLTANGLTWAADVDSYDNDTDSGELEYLHEAIVWANTLLDSALAKHGISYVSRPANEWCKQRVVDIAVYRIMSLGGREVPKIIADDYDRSLKLIRRAEDGDLIIPGLTYPSTVTNSGRQTFNMPFAVNPSGSRSCRR